MYCTLSNQVWYLDQRLDGLSDEGREEMLQLPLDGATIDNRNSVNLILSIPTEDVVSNAGTEPSSRSSNRQKKVRFSWEVDLDATNQEIQADRQMGVPPQS